MGRVLSPSGLQYSRLISPHLTDLILSSSTPSNLVQKALQPLLAHLLPAEKLALSVEDAWLLLPSRPAADLAPALDAAAPAPVSGLLALTSARLLFLVPMREVRSPRIDATGERNILETQDHTREHE